ncbi:MAG: efflux RND transporter periplasmic adaptor subunit [Arenibacterium sp.]
MRFLRQSLLGLMWTFLALALLAFAGQTVMSALQERMSAQPRTFESRERVFAVNVVEARLQRHVPVLEAFGEVQSRRQLELRTAVRGRVTELAEAFEEGGEVRAGDLLVQLDPADNQAELDRVKNDVRDAEAEQRDAERSLILSRDDLMAGEEQLELRQKAFNRQIDLQARGVTTAAAVEAAELSLASARQAVVSRRQALAQAEARVDQAATRLARAEIARDQAERDLTETSIHAAFDATLSEVSLVEGRLVAANEKLAMLIDPKSLEVAFRISTAQYARLLDDQGDLLGLPVRVTLDVAGVDLTAFGRISRDNVSAGSGQSGRLVYARLDSAPAFKPGDFVRVAVDEPALDQVARLPASALGSDGAVLVVGEDERLETLPVTLVRRQGNDVLVRGQGLESRQVVKGRTPLLGTGIRVRVLSDEATETQASAPELLELSPERRERLVAFIEGNNRMPSEMKARVLSQLSEAKVPAKLVARIESRMGG